MINQDSQKVFQGRNLQRFLGPSLGSPRTALLLKCIGQKKDQLDYIQFADMEGN